MLYFSLFLFVLFWIDSYWMSCVCCCAPIARCLPSRARVNVCARVWASERGTVAESLCCYFHFAHKLLWLSFGLTKISSSIISLSFSFSFCPRWLQLMVVVLLPSSPARQRYCYIILEHSPISNFAKRQEPFVCLTHVLSTFGIAVKGALNGTRNKRCEQRDPYFSLALHTIEWIFQFFASLFVRIFIISSIFRSQCALSLSNRLVS